MTVALDVFTQALHDWNDDEDDYTDMWVKVIFRRTHA